MNKRAADRLAMGALAAATLFVTWPLLANLDGLPPDDEELGLDIMGYYAFGGAARTIALQYHQFPLRSPWHGGGYPIYANPDDLTLSPTMLLILTVGPWAALKLDFAVTMIVAGAGMFLLTRRKMGYSLPAALLSATAFAFGGFLMARWMRGWYVPIHAAWLPIIMYALWRGRRRRLWLAVAAVLVAWLLIDQKYVAIVMGWFLLMVGLLRLDDEESTAIGPAWGYFARVVAVFGFGAGLAAVKLVPLWPIVRDHLRAGWQPPQAGGPWPAMGLWAVIALALGVAPYLTRLVRQGRDHRAAAVTVGLFTAVVLAAWLWAPRPEPNPPPAYVWLEEVADGVVSFGGWGPNQHGDPAPEQEQGFRVFSPTGCIVGVLWVLAFFLRPRKSWRWGILVALFLLLNLGRIMPRDLQQSLKQLPLLGWIRDPPQHVNFYLFFLLTLLAGRALDLPHWLRRHRTLRLAAWVILAGNVVYLGWSTHERLAYTVTEPLPPAAEFVEDEYHLLDRPADEWRHQVCFLLRENTGLVAWPLDFRDLRQSALTPSLIAAQNDPPRPDPGFEGMASFNEPENHAELVEFTPNHIAVRVNVSRPGVLWINQIGDSDWRPRRGTLEPDALLLGVRLTEIGKYRVELDYVPRLLYRGLVVSVVTAIVGILLLWLISRRRAGARADAGGPSDQISR